MGVQWHAVNRKWYAQISHEGKHLHIGLFDNEVDAMEARIEVVKTLRGECLAYYDVMKDSTNEEGRPTWLK